MPLSTLVVGVLLVAQTASPASVPSLESRAGLDMDWLRGAVVSASSSSMTLRHRTRTLEFVVGADTRYVGTRGDASAIASLRAGSAIEVHYTRQGKKRHAVVVFDAVAAAKGARTASAGDSTLGIVNSNREGMGISTARRGSNIAIESASRLLDADGRLIARGRRDIASRLSTGQLVVVTWYEVLQSNESPDDYTGKPISRRYALDIRTVRQ